MPNASHQEAAEFHELAAHAHRAEVAHQGKEDRQTGHEHSGHAFELANRAWQPRRQAHAECSTSAGSADIEQNQ